MTPRTRKADDAVRTTSSREGQRRRRPLPLLVAGAAAATVLLVATYTQVGRFWTAYVFVTLNFYIGVVALVALSLTVMGGLASTDRIMLRIGHRVLVQGVHRATAIVAVVALGVHVAVKILESHAGIGDAIVPFFSPNRSLFVGFGTVASYLLLLSYWTGLARSRFIGRVRPRVWRLLHSVAYLCWPIAMLHGLNAGRQAATWVSVSYLGCLVLVGLGLLVRVFTRFGRYATGVKTERPIGVTTQTVVAPRVPGVSGASATSGQREQREEPLDPYGQAQYGDRRDREGRENRGDAGYPGEEPVADRSGRPHLRLAAEDGRTVALPPTRSGRRNRSAENEPVEADGRTWEYDTGSEGRAYRPARTSDGWAPDISEPDRYSRGRHIAQ